MLDRPRLRIGLAGNPNCGKSALFNALTGARQKVANYPGVTVERRTGLAAGDHGQTIEMMDLPGSYSLSPKSPDEQVTHDIILGKFPGEAPLDLLICVVDATNLRQHLRFALELKKTGLPIVVALNMMDLARRDEIDIDVKRLSHELGLNVVPTVAVRKQGLEDLKAAAIDILDGRRPALMLEDYDPLDIKTSQQKAREIAQRVILSEGASHRTTRLLDSVFLHRIAGPIILFALLFVMFQAVFAWAEWPMEMIDAGVVALQDLCRAHIAAGWLRSLVNDGVLAGVGSVVVFLPQILILFAFILVLEASGYMARAAFLMDRLMASVGLNGRAFIPLLSSFACAIPGIMAARSISSPRDRLTTILIAPLMTCSARLPVYTLIISAFIPNTPLPGGVGLQGAVMFGLYLAGILSALAMAFIFKRTLTKGASQPFLMELPKYQMPHLRDLLIGLWERVKIFMRRAGRIILVAMIVLWGLSTFPNPPLNATEPDIYYSFAGMIGRALHVILAPIGFNWEISIALVPGMAAREVAVAALGTVYSLSGNEEAVTRSLTESLQSAWPLPTALSFLVWYIFAPQCLSTLAVARRETNSLKWPLVMAGYLFVLAYLGSFLTYHLASALMG